ncbi:RagB/SusD family nutrient uptake outer membrane protein [Dysgonomonas massiliensis]|uniref:RagB/SusD family nutrient uptake outer membrane protein n=1 Tax=Dysgonomonas massiliensis TaxID=2040292 RepID=UPI000C76D8F9|nr:RagB/SusD family nutrient uptake outer membrane protein [Dysgonomonas massiliensis]
MKKNIYTISKLLFIAFFSIAISSSFVSCLEDNINEHAATDDDMDKDNLRVGGFFNTMLKDVIPTSDVDANDYQRAQNLTGDIFSGYMAHIGTWNSSSHNGTYNLYFDKWNDVGFTNGYGKVMGPYFNINKTIEEMDSYAAADIVKAMSTIVKIMGMHRLTDNYGPIPYTEFGKGGLTTPYDSQETIYKSFLDELKEATTNLAEYLDADPATTKILDKFDMIYGGDIHKWLKLGNTLRLRLAMRICYVEPELAKKHAEEAANQKYGLLSDPTDIAQLKSYGGHIVYHPLETVWNSYADTRMGASMDSYLNGYNDPRLSYYFQTSSYGGYNGARNGLVINDKAPYVKLSAPNIQKNTPVLWMSPAEAYFLLAEGALRGWNMGGTAQDFYEEGIRASFAQHGASGVDGYIQNSTDIPARFVDKVSYNNINAYSSITIAWKSSSNFETNLERIITQKWIAMFPEGQEAWTEFRRTGYPKLFPVVKNNSNGNIDTQIQIRRIVFPQEEYNKNREEVDKAVGLLGGPDTGGTKLWWDAK